MIGHITLDRKIMAWEWYNDSVMFHLFIHFLLNANHKDSSYKGTNIKRGQLIVGRLKLSATLCLSEMQIRHGIKRLKKTKEITTHITNRFTIVTICKYDSYQSKKNNSIQQDAQQITNEIPNSYPTDNQQITTNNNDNNINNEKKIRKEIKKEFSEDFDFWETHKQSFLNGGDWIFKFCTDKNIPLAIFESKAKVFIDDLELKQDYKNLKEIRRHFVNWYNLNEKKKFTDKKNKANTSTPQSNDIYDSMK